MVKLAYIPSQAVIDGFRGVVDFACQLGIPYARKWPAPPCGDPPLSVTTKWEPFSYINKAAKDLPSVFIKALRRSSSDSNQSWKDLLIILYYRGIPGAPGEKVLWTDLDFHGAGPRFILNFKTDVKCFCYMRHWLGPPPLYPEHRYRRGQLFATLKIPRFNERNKIPQIQAGFVTNHTINIETTKIEPVGSIQFDAIDPQGDLSPSLSPAFLLSDI